MKRGVVIFRNLLGGADEKYNGQCGVPIICIMKTWDCQCSSFVKLRFTETLMCHLFCQGDPVHDQEQTLGFIKLIESI